METRPYTITNSYSGADLLQKAFVVEDDDGIREMLVYALKTSGFEADGFECRDGLMNALEQAHVQAQEPPAIILLDIMLPGSDGIEILGELRRLDRYKHIPVIIITAKGGEMDRIRGLDLGADDYVTKPFSVMEVISRVKAVLRRCAPAAREPEALVIGDICLMGSKRRVLADGVAVTLTYKEFELLHYLMLNEGIVLSRDRLLAQVWGYDYAGESRTVDMHIKTLRQKLGACGALIDTVRNVGYRIGG